MMSRSRSARSTEAPDGEILPLVKLVDHILEQKRILKPGVSFRNNLDMLDAGLGKTQSILEFASRARRGVEKSQQDVALEAFVVYSAGNRPDRRRKGTRPLLVDLEKLGEFFLGDFRIEEFGLQLASVIFFGIGESPGFESGGSLRSTARRADGRRVAERRRRGHDDLA